MSNDSHAPPCAGPSATTYKPGFDVPRNACDTHAHILGPASRYPYSDERVYTPPDCLLPQYQHMLAALGVQRCVLVQPSVYGSDNRVLLEALHATGDQSRGVAVIAPDIPQQQLWVLHEAGVRGVRLNIVDTHARPGELPVALLHALEERIAPLGWHIELLAHVNQYPALDRLLTDFTVPFVFGHFGYAPAALGPDDAGLQALLRMAEQGRAWIKMTGPYRLAAQAWPYQSVDAIAQEVMQRCPEQLLWGSDWPHVMLKGEMPDDARLFDLLAQWVPDAALRVKVLCDNPARLYGW